MFYHLFDIFYTLPGSRLMHYITFRSVLALVLSLLIAIFIGRRIIERLQLMQGGEIVRDLGLEGQMQKKGTPTMGGIIMIIAIVVPCLLVGKLNNVYMLLMIFATLWLGLLGLADDFLKIHRHNKDGLKGRYKIVGQLGLGLVVGITMWLSPDIVMRENFNKIDSTKQEIVVSHHPHDSKAARTTIPFVKNHNLDYAWTGRIFNLDKEACKTLGWIVFVIVTIFVVMAVSNGANLTDGIDGLCAGTSAIIGIALAIMCYLGGNVIYASYLDIMYIPESSELVVYAAAFIGATIGFLWYNSYPAQVFMGDTGSLMLGGVIAVFAILIRKELLIPIMCLVFFVEDLSVVMQTTYFKFTKKRFGEGHRIFKMTPLHHHYQKDVDPNMKVLIKWPKKAIPEPKITMRFFLVAIFLAVLTFVTLKIR